MADWKKKAGQYKHGKRITYKSNKQIRAEKLAARDKEFGAVMVVGPKPEQCKTVFRMPIQPQG